MNKQPETSSTPQHCATCRYWLERIDAGKSVCWQEWIPKNTQPYDSCEEYIYENDTITDLVLL